ncbi:unnamed protein product [Rangifer tarandus platyrhynchus]|uniref:Uncharacterized protein n=1 Tax=Rangifer tarandus platyrhynchus TaxID=3082113 RepID=A0AC59Y4R2_RANTA
MEAKRTEFTTEIVANPHFPAASVFACRLEGPRLHACHRKYKPWLRTATPEIDMLLATTKACGTDLEISLQTKGGQIKAEHQRLCGQRRGREFVPAVIGALVKSPQFA